MRIYESKHLRVFFYWISNINFLTEYPVGVYNTDTRRGIFYIKDSIMEEKKCCCKTTVRDEKERKKLIHRLNRIEGQIRGIRTMVENNAYCNDILIQSAAVNAAVNAFNRELIGSHLRGCVSRDLRAGNDDVIDELLSTLQKLMK